MSLAGAMRKAVHFSFLVLAPLLTVPASALANDQKLVFAAASLTRPLNEILMLYNAANDDGAVASYASSGTLARQIQNGAEPAIFVSANRSWVTDLVQSGHIALQDVSEIASNTLVVIAPIKDNKRLRDGEDVLTPSGLTRALEGERLAMADP
ncbi:MAG: molybdate ABC transporter substrate-binding protein, partial [Pseudomonadota bacterium]